MKGKSISKAKMEDDFAALLTGMRPSREIFALSKAVFSDAWDIQNACLKQDADTMRREIIKIDRKSEQFMDRVVEADSPTLITAYEKKIRKLEEEKIRLDEKIAKCGRPLQSFDETFQTALSFLENPQILWQSGSVEHQRTLLKLGFSDNLIYCKKEGFQTPAKAYPFWLIGHFCDGKYEMVEPVGLEPTTSTLPALRSTG